MAEYKILRILIEINSVGAPPDNDHQEDKRPWKATFTIPEIPERSSWNRTRDLIRKKIGSHYYPVVEPGEEGLSDSGERHHALCTGTSAEDLEELYDRITMRSPVKADKDVSTFGKYLYYTLIGDVIWEEICTIARDEAADVLELCIALEQKELNLHRINWEMIHGPEDFLAAKLPKAPREVAITRLVQGADHEPKILSAVPRCLFVIGTSLTDWRIRPGAEYLGLLRQLERSGRAIHSKVLRGRNGQGATPEDIKQAMIGFGPELVHFICHGEFDDKGNVHLELAAEQDEQETRRLCNTDEIFQYLNEGENPPAIVVLSACNSGKSGAIDLLAPDAPENDEGDRPEVEMRGAHETAPMAARLVSKGIPVVIGMAGRVADSACRHFTRRFGDTMVKGDPLVKATADGRRAAFAYDDQSAEESVDWAFPAVFVSAKVDANFRPAPATSAASIPPVETWVHQFHLKRGKEPVLCGRHKFFDAYYDLFENDKPAVLGAYIVPPEEPNLSQHEKHRFGKTRIIRELTVQAIRDGHIPVVVSSDSRNWAAPNTLAELLNELFKALNAARRIFDIASTTWQIKALQDILKNRNTDLHPDVEEIYQEENETVNARVIREALSIDMTYLVEKAHDEPISDNGNEPSEQALARYDFFKETQGSAILFLDDVDKYDEQFLTDWLGGDVLGKGGLRRNEIALLEDNEHWDPARTILPVLMTITTSGAPNIIIKSIKERGQSLGWMRLEQLKPFSKTNGADLLAYEHVLLNPWDMQGELRRNVSNRFFNLNHKTDRQNWETWCEYIREEFGGHPYYFETKECYRTVEIALKMKFLEEADDERRLEEYMKKDADQ